jgi:hypothetical protein
LGTHGIYIVENKKEESMPGEGADLALEIKEAIEIDGTNIVEELRRHSAKYFYYGVLWARAAKQQRKLHIKTKSMEAELMKTARVENPKLSAEMKNEYLYGHPDYLQAQQDEIQGTYMEEVLNVATQALKQRGMALQELARQNRTEEFYGDEFKAMKAEYSERVQESSKRHRRTKAEMEAAKSVEKNEIPQEGDK